MARGTGLRVGFDGSLVLAGLVLVWLGPLWVMNHAGQSWFFGALVTLVLGIGILVGVVVHELGHAWAARLLGVEVRGIRVAWWGGSTALGPAAFSASALISLAGPVVNGLFAGLLWVFSSLGGPAWLSLGFLLGSWINLFLTIFNLLPFAPLDGSHLVSDLVSWGTGSREKGERLVAWLGLALIPLGASWLVLTRSWSSWQNLLLWGLLVFLVGKYSFDKLRQVELSQRSGVTVGDFCSPVVMVEAGTVLESLPLGQDLVVQRAGQVLGFVPRDLLVTVQGVSPQLGVEQMMSPLASYRVPSSLGPLELGEFAAGHFLVQARRELGEGSSPSWLVYRGGQVLGLLHHRQHLARGV